MSVGAKICGINSRAALEAAIAGGTEFIGFIFYPPSPRYIAPEDAGQLAKLAPPHIKKVGVFVDADPDEIDGVMLETPLDVLQFHGSESPCNIDDLRIIFRLPVIKAIKIGAPDDVTKARAFEGHADYLMFDAKPPADLAGALPGGNAVRFDWTLLADTTWKTPWFLSGGLTPENLGDAVRATGAKLVDVSSGVEVRPGLKDPAKIAAFLAAAKAL